VPVSHRLVGGLLGLALGGFRRLPAVVAFAVADALAVLLVVASWLREKRVGRGVNRNLRIVYREQLTPKAARRLRWAWARHMIWMAVDFCRMPRIQKSNVSQFVDVSEIEALRAECHPGKGAICVTGHIGVPELLGHVTSLCGIECTSVFRTRRNRAVDDQLTWIRASGGQKILSKGGSLWSVKKALDRGEAVGMAVDEYTRDKPVFVPFLGTLAATSAAVARLHLATGSPMVVLSLERLARVRYRFRVWEVIRHAPTGNREADVEAVLRQMNQALSRAILAHPEQWFWGGRRFRNRPPGEVPGADGLPPTASLERTAAPIPWRDEAARTCAQP